MAFVGQTVTVVGTCTYMLCRRGYTREHVGETVRSLRGITFLIVLAVGCFLRDTICRNKTTFVIVKATMLRNILRNSFLLI